MIKNKQKNTKCSSINVSDDYRVLTDTLSNPYCYNFGKKSDSIDSNIFQKMHNRVNFEYFSRK